MRMAAAYGKYVATLVAFVAFLVFAFRVNEKLKLVLSSGERVVLVGAAIAGAAFLIAKANAYLSERLIGNGK